MAEKKDLMVYDLGVDGTINISSSKWDHVYVHVKDGEFLSMGVDRGREGAMKRMWTWMMS